MVKYDNAMFYLKKRKALLPYTEEEYKSYLDEHPDSVYFELITDAIQTIAPVSGTLDESENYEFGTTLHAARMFEIADILIMMLKEICEYDDTKPSDLLTKSGAISSVIITNTKVIKMGYGRATTSFPDNPYIVAPLFRKFIELDGAKCFVEITEKVQTLKPDEVSKEELYSLYKELRDLGLVWTDASSRNVGRLLKDNVVHWDKKIANDDDALTLNLRRDNKVLKAGDLVILDADFIYEERDPAIRDNMVSYLSVEFDTRYRNEIKNGHGTL